MSTSTIRRVAALASLALIAPIGVGIAMADYVVNNITATNEQITIAAGSNASVGFTLLNQNTNQGDTNNSCNVSGSGTVQIGFVNLPTGITAGGTIQIGTCDGNPVSTTFAVAPGTVAGTYNITSAMFTAANQNGASGTYDFGQAAFKIVVPVSNTPPVVTISSPASGSIEGDALGGANVTIQATASDAQDGSLTPTCTASSGVFAVGPHSFSCSVTDSGGLSGSANVSFTVVDTTPPSLSALGNIVEEAISAAGATVTYSATATDIVDGPITPVCTSASGSTFALGTTAVMCTATDNAGNSASATFNVTVQDTTAPTLTVPVDITTVATSAAGAVVNFTASASDIVDGPVTPNCNPASGSTFAPGTTTVICTATDAAGNTSDPQSFKVKVGFDFVGFAQPVDNKMLNGMKAGSTAPMKWRVTDGDGGFISSLSIVTSMSSVVMSCTSNLPEDALEEYATGGTQLRYDLTADQFVYNWQSPKKAGSCYKVRIVLTDGGVYEAMFRLR